MCHISHKWKKAVYLNGNSLHLNDRRENNGHVNSSLPGQNGGQITNGINLNRELIIGFR